jgi:hypothetical protein
MLLLLGSILILDFTSKDTFICVLLIKLLEKDPGVSPILGAEPVV